MSLRPIINTTYELNAGDNMEVIQRLPETTEEDKRHVVMDGGHDLRWLQSIRSTGAHICLLGNKDRPMTLTDLEAELSGPRRGRHACILIYEKVCHTLTWRLRMSGLRVTEKAFAFTRGQWRGSDNHNLLRTQVLVCSTSKIKSDLCVKVDMYLFRDK